MAFSSFLVIPGAIFFVVFLGDAMLCLCMPSCDIYDTVQKGTNFWNNDLDDDLDKQFRKMSYLLKLNLDGLTLKETRQGCGRMQNRLGVLSDGTAICIRYRENLEQIQGELLSYHTSKLLGLENVLEAKLLRIEEKSEFWSRLDFRDNSWDNGKLVIATKFIDDLYPVRIPDIILKQNFRLDRNTSFCGLDRRVQRFLLQWSDMVVYDFVIGNFDRVVSNMFNMQWYSKSLSEPIENLLQLRNGVLLFIDNEDGISHGYRLLGRYQPYLQSLIQHLCIFRNQTVRRLEELDSLTAEALGQRLWNSVSRSYNDSRILDYIPQMSAKNLHIFKNRISLVRGYIKECERNIQ